MKPLMTSSKNPVCVCGHVYEGHAAGKCYAVTKCSCSSFRPTEPSPQTEENCFICRKPIEPGQTSSTIHTGCHAICPHNPCEDCVAAIRQDERAKTVEDAVEAVEELMEDWKINGFKQDEIAGNAILKTLRLLTRIKEEK